MRETPATMRLLIPMLLALCLLSSAASGVTLEFWHTWPHAAQAVQSLAYKYTQQTGVSIHIRVLRPAGRLSWGASGGPDLAGLYEPTQRDIAAMVRADSIEDLKIEMSHGWYARFWPALLENFEPSYSEGTSIYGVPLTCHMCVFVYNKQLFQKAGVSVPTSWDGLMASSRKLSKIGVTPYAGGFGSDMPPLAAAYEYAYLGQHLLLDTYAGRFPYTKPEWLAYLSLYTQMRQNRFTNPASANATEAAAAKALMDGRVAMVFMDASFESIRRSYKPGFAAWGVFGAPTDGKSRFLPKLPGGVVEGLVINRHSRRKAEAIAFAKWLTEYNQQLAFADGSSSIPAVSPASNSALLTARLRPFASLGMRDLALDLRIYENPRVLATFYSGVRGILAGTATASSVARRTQAVKARR